MTVVKICGVNSPAAFDAVVDAEADYLGFVFFAASPRFITADTAAALSARHVGGPKRSGLLVAPTDQDVAAILAAVRLDVLQLYTDAKRAREVKEKFGIPVWRAVGVSQAADLPIDDEGLDGFVIEAKAPPEASRPGGNAMKMDWSLLKDWPAPGYWLLGGGLHPGNVEEAITATGTTGVDVSSGVETAPGVKSPALIQEFVNRARKQVRAF